MVIVNSAVENAVEKIGATPERFSPTYAGCRRYILNRYPYNVIYHRRMSEFNQGKLTLSLALSQRPG